MIDLAELPGLLWPEIDAQVRAPPIVTVRGPA